MPAPICLALLAACLPDGVAVGVPWLELPDEVSFDDARFGRTNDRLVVLPNSGTAEARVDATASPPFLTLGEALQIAAGASGGVTVLFTPDDFEPVDGTLVVTTGLDTWELPIRATVDRDADDDGHEALEAGGDDCDEDDPRRHAGAVETCDGVDEDCDGIVDDADDAPAWWPDADDDGHGDRHATPFVGCVAPPGSLGDADDCDDALSTVHPGAFEVWYDGVDQDCDGNDDDQDLDLDPHPLDCDDLDPTVGPSAPELDDGLDQDCDALLDEDLWVRGTLLVTEIMPDALVVPDFDGRWLELHNPTDGHVDLGALVVTVGAQPSTPAPSWLAPGGVAVLCLDEFPTHNGGVTCAGTLSSWTNGARTVVVSGGGVDLDEVDWSGWPYEAGASAALQPGSFDPDANDLVTAWCTSTAPFGDGDLGTPGVITAPCP